VWDKLIETSGLSIVGPVRKDSMSTKGDFLFLQEVKEVFMPDGSLDIWHRSASVSCTVLYTSDQRVTCAEWMRLCLWVMKINMKIMI